MKRLILTPTKEKKCGMYQLAKDLDGQIETLKFPNPILKIIFPMINGMNIHKWQDYDEIITFIYPMHTFGRDAQKKGVKWICYDQGTPSPELFKNFWRRQYMKLFTWLNKRSMQGCDEYWWVGDIKQKSRYQFKKDYALYLGRKEDYKNFYWLKQVMELLEIPFVWSEDFENDAINALLSHAKLLVTASGWEGYGRPVSEAQNLGIPVVCYDVGAHKKLVKKGSVIEPGDKAEFANALIKWYYKK